MQLNPNKRSGGMRFWEWIGASLSPLNHDGVHPNGLLTRLIWGSRDALVNLPPQSNPPLAAWTRSRNVLEYEPWPQILNEPKSLYQSPSGTSGVDSIQTRS